jgi:hypothetical protein
MAIPTRTLLRTVEGPKGKAAIYEVMQESDNASPVAEESVEYEVVCNEQTHMVRALGEASIVAEELAGR